MIAERNKRLASRVVIGVLLCCTLEPWARGAPLWQSESKPERASDTNAQGARKQSTDLKPSIPDVELFNQDGKRIRFYSDLIKDKVVIISFSFTSCAFICPMQGESLSKIQALLGERLGREVNLISVSTDPETDTPERLKAWGAQFGAKPGWTFVTGEKTEIDKVTKAFTGAEAIKGEHSPVVFIGSDRTGIWVRAYGLAAPERFNKLIEEVTK